MTSLRAYRRAPRARRAEGRRLGARARSSSGRWSSSRPGSLPRRAWPPQHPSAQPTTSSDDAWWWAAAAGRGRRRGARATAGRGGTTCWPARRRLAPRTWVAATTDATCAWLGTGGCWADVGVAEAAIGGGATGGAREEAGDEPDFSLPRAQRTNRGWGCFPSPTLTFRGWEGDPGSNP